MRPWIAVIGWFGVVSTFAQPRVQVDTVRAVRPWEPHAEYTFPRLVMPDRPAVAARIDRHLCIDFLEADPDTAGGRLFERVWGNAGGTPLARVNDLGWVVRQPLPGLVEVELEGEGCGAYCEGFTTRYQYDLRSGAYLPYDSLFTPQGLAAMNDTLHALWAAELNAYNLAKVDSLADTEIDPAYVEQVRASLELYRSCLAERPDTDPYVVDYVVEDKALRFFIARCAAHADLPLDELDPVSFALPFQWCLPWMRQEVQGLFR